MRDLQKNQESLKYSTYSDQITIYAKDSDGNIIYDDVDGEKVPRIESERAGYNSPVSFENSIATSGQSDQTEYGFANGSYSAVMVTVDKSLPIDEKSLIWHTSEPQFDSNGMVIPESADYVVKAKRTNLDGVTYLLDMNTKGE